MLAGCAPSAAVTPAFGPAAPDHAGRPALSAGVRPGACGRWRARSAGYRAGLLSLTPAEQAVARLVAAGRPAGKPQPSRMPASRLSGSASGTSSTSSASDPARTSSPVSAPRRLTCRETRVKPGAAPQ